MHEVDAVVIGGGFFGCCLARYLRAGMDRVLLVEAGRELMGRASRVNQARVHAGFHYPRSFRTAVRSHQLMRRFEADFGGAVVDGFEMAYAIAIMDATEPEKKEDQGPNIDEIRNDVLGVEKQEEVAEEADGNDAAMADTEEEGGEPPPAKAARVADESRAPKGPDA